jgi:uncharacterized protein (UPF0264 family)
LISVRNVREAQSALAGGCDVIDIKEPTRGSLGCADEVTIRAISAQVNGVVSVSAALGELTDLANAHSKFVSQFALPAKHEEGASDGCHARQTLDYIKLGLADAPRDWRQQLTRLAEMIGRDRFVAVAYADAARAGAPDVDAVLQWAIDRRVAGFLIDTHEKNGVTLFDHLPAAALRPTVQRAQAHKLFVALAGSLRQGDLPDATALGPDLVALRGAACDQNDRESAICADRVRELSRLNDARQTVDAITDSSAY